MAFFFSRRRDLGGHASREVPRRRPKEAGEGRRVREVMRSVPAWCVPSHAARTAAEVMRDYSLHRVSVIAPETGELLGTLSERELCLKIVAGGLDPNATSVEAIMRRDPPICEPEMSFSAARRLMARERAQQLPVVDGRRRLIGTVFLADLLTQS